MFRSVRKTYRYAQEKAVSPEETVARVKERWKKVGLPPLEVVSLKEYDRLGLPVYTCVPKSRVPLPGLSGTFGKGGTETEALASALMELVERVSGFTFLSRLDSFSLAAPEEVPFPEEDLLRPFDPVYHDPEILKRLRRSPFLWAKGLSLKDEKETPVPLHWFHFLYGTTGWAAGNTLEEATHQALCEVIERHAISTVVEEGRVVPTIEPESIKAPVAREILARFEEAGLSLLLKDFSVGLRVPTIAAFAYDPNPPHPKLRYYATAGTHPDRELALVRALIELAQHRAQFVYSEKVLKKPGGATYCFPTLERPEDLAPFEEGERLSFEEIASFHAEDFREELDFIRGELARVGLPIYLVETTHPELEIPTVIVSVPGARLNRPSTKIHPFVLLSRQLMNLGRYAEAAEALEEAFSAQPGLKQVPQILCQAARCYKLAGDPAAAGRYFELAGKVAPYLLQSPKFRAEWAEVIQASSG